ncbi:hypothetical protein FOA52_014563 [Chlamydomonas sp. UWO 241]|nr:hypothetical protein FOA52_014563 [Chlamydomonas sp. UWO 241]
MPGIVATVGGNNIQLWDTRTMAMTAQTKSAHRMPTRDVSWSPAHEHRLVSGGDDCKLRFWDSRMLDRGDALLELGGHSHWVWQAQYSPHHDALIASSSSDSLVNLYRAPRLSATTTATPATATPGSTGGAASGGTAAHAAATPTTAGAAASAAATGGGAAGDVDGLAHTYDEHEDSVYGLAWSAVDPWLFASLSYDGRVVLNKVPKAVKYAVLL